jgi:hypothetical protein
MLQMQRSNSILDNIGVNQDNGSRALAYYWLATLLNCFSGDYLASTQAAELTGAEQTHHSNPLEVTKLKGTNTSRLSIFLQYTQYMQHTECDKGQTHTEPTVVG